ncbi:MAG: hypothetical protein NC041_01505 [Bacteroides sp.]|nr:hypothetical protein [Prevotella sp.]MCM1407721.1 hypothetical protein [Treponema brennaborense]MCM1469129.1 hypothetical protein [Bacteroides sp.]
MKRKLFVILSLIIASNLFAQKFSKELKDNGMHQFATTMNFLAANKIDEEIVIYNNSSVDLANISCKVTINGKTHDFKKIRKIIVGDDENFSGYEDDEMKDEFKRYFGSDGKISKNNTNDIIFEFNFGEFNNDVVLKRVYKDDRDICFSVDDKLHASSADNSDSGNAEKILINGEEYLLLNEQVYKIR